MKQTKAEQIYEMFQHYPRSAIFQLNTSSVDARPVTEDSDLIQITFHDDSKILYNEKSEHMTIVDPRQLQIGF